MMATSRLIFAGTPEFAVPALHALLSSDYTVVAVYTQPDRPAGRGRQLRPSPVKTQALAAGIPVYQPTHLRDPRVQAELAALTPDLVIVAAYGLILPSAVLAIPRLGCVNIHASLLPRWRGAAPIQRAILAGDVETGISIMQMEAGLDTGPVYQRVMCPITPSMTGGELHDQLAILGATCLQTLLPSLLCGQVQATPQQHHQATYAAKLEKAEAELDWTQPALALERKVLAFNPYPVAQTHIHNGQTLRIWCARATPQPCGAPPGSVLSESAEGIGVATGEGILYLTELQLPGGRPLSAPAFLAARHLAGQRLGAA